MIGIGLVEQVVPAARGALGFGGGFGICHHRAVRNAGHGFKPGMAGCRLSPGSDRQREVLQFSSEIGEELIRCFT